MGEILDFSVRTLGECSIPSPIRLSGSGVKGDRSADYVSDAQKILYDLDAAHYGRPGQPDGSGVIECAGPRRFVYFNPRHVRAGILTCGGLCPGLNDVIRELVRTLWLRYGVTRITGVRWGYHGFLGDMPGDTLMDLDPDVVDDIHRLGGSLLGTSRGGGERTAEIVDSIERLNMNMLFVIGGDGTQKGALAIVRETERRGLKVAVIGIPKTVDNDLSFIDKSFGFETAVGKATETVGAAHQEAHSAFHGIGLVKVMGRESGFIAACTSLASHDVNFVLIPEVPFELEGPNGLFAHLKNRLLKRNHAVIVVAEGAGREFFPAQDLGKDESGNAKLGDIGLYLKARISDWFAADGTEITLKYIDPSYIIRSSEAAPADSMYCSRLATNAVHAAMAGKTGMLISELHNTFVHIPLEVAVSRRNLVDPESPLWLDVIQALGMPERMTNPA
ncbi:MAG: ATP-dependent 6-phosphofructokinase [Rectinemataceae bacterium]